MNWLPLMTLRDGTVIEMPMPSRGDTSHEDVHGYRVRGNDGVTEFSTLPELVNHVLDPGSPHLEELLRTSAAAAAGGCRR